MRTTTMRTTTMRTTTMRTTSMRTTTMRTTTMRTTTMKTTDNSCNVENSSTQYCYTLPKSYEIIDQYDNDPFYYHVDKDFNAGNSIIFSKVCSEKWYWPGSASAKADGTPKHRCDNFHPANCHIQLETLLSAAVPSPDGYVTVLNCPMCGCTPGENDAVTMTELEAGTRSADINIQEILSELTYPFEAPTKN